MRLEEKIDAYWKLSNYITVLQMYAKDNVTLERDMLLSDLKKVPRGHWGTSPGINFIYAHLNALISENKQKTLLVNGIGHSAVAMISNLFLEGTLAEYYPELCLSKEGLKKLVKSFGTTSGFRTEMNPGIPGCIYDGGELGYSLPVAYGAAMDNNDLLIPCIIGDGEAETGTIATSWHLNKYINFETDGAVLPILHLNGYRMGASSLFSSMGDFEILSYFKAFFLEPIIVEMNHHDMQAALNWSINKIKNCKLNRDCKGMPIIILKSLKGLSCPIKIEGDSKSHKIVPLGENPEQSLQRWLQSYQPNSLFDSDFNISDNIHSIIPNKNLSMGSNMVAYGRNVEKTLKTPPISTYFFDINIKEKISNISHISEYLNDIFEENDKGFRVFSPDEMTSNKLHSVVVKNKLCYNIIKTNDNIQHKEGKIIEILSETVCNGLMQGYTISGKNALFPTYEAFAPIFSSMVAQSSKFLYQWNKYSWRKNIPSLNYLLTSICWENTYSHQNPDLIDTLCSKQFDFINIYYPCDANSHLTLLNKSLLSTNQINCIIVSKQNQNQYLSGKEAIEATEMGYVLRDNFLKNEVPDIILVGIGDYMAQETTWCFERISQEFPSLKIRLIFILELTILCKEKFNSDLFSKLFCQNSKIIFAFSGNKTTIEGILFNKRTFNISVYGYRNLSDITAPALYKMIRNKASRYDIINNVYNYLEEHYFIMTQEQKNKIEKEKKEYMFSVENS